MQEERKLKAILFRLQEGREQFDKVKMVRLQGKDVNMLLMLDHAPVIGEIEGDMRIVCDDEEYDFSNVHGYFHFKHNEFRFLQQDFMEETQA